MGSAHAAYSRSKGGGKGLGVGLGAATWVLRVTALALGHSPLYRSNRLVIQASIARIHDTRHCPGQRLTVEHPWGAGACGTVSRNARSPQRLRLCIKHCFGGLRLGGYPSVGLNDTRMHPTHAPPPDIRMAFFLILDELPEAVGQVSGG